MKRFLSLFLLVAMVFVVFGGAACADETEVSERSADIVILYTSDVHCGVDKGFGYAGLAEIRDYLVGKGDDVILVDDGDNIQGEPIGTFTRGEASIELMNQMGYSIAIPGNHEFDYGMDQFLALTEKAEFEYISCNFNYKGELLFKPYVIRELGGAKVAFIGVTTPESLSSSVPRHFQNDEGEFVYGFFQDSTGESLYDAVQTAVDDAHAEGADYVIVMGHLGNAEECRPWTYADVIEHTSGIDVFLDGHSHDTNQVEMKDRDGNLVLRSACGTKLANIGWVRITKEGKVNCGLYTWTNDVSVTDLLGVENDMFQAVTAVKMAVEEKQQEIVAESAVYLTINDPSAVDLKGNPIRMVRRAETNLGDLCADAFRIQAGADIGIINGGGVRDNIQAGDVRLYDIYMVNPFSNELCVVEVTGQQILDALEWGARAVPDENGGFLQVSGLSYEIHSYIETPCQADETSQCIGIKGERRVKNVLVGGEPLDPKATYTLAGQNFTLIDKGDGFTMFEGASVLNSGGKLASQALIDYITEDLGGIIGEEYEELTGEGRIVIIEEKP